MIQNLFTVKNETPYTLTKYTGRSHWYRNTPDYTEDFPTLRLAIETKKLIEREEPTAYIEITKDGKIVA